MPWRPADLTQTGTCPLSPYLRLNAPLSQKSLTYSLACLSSLQSALPSPCAAQNDNTRRRSCVQSTQFLSCQTAMALNKTFELEFMYCLQEKPFWKKLLAPTSTQSTAATNPDSDVASMQTGMSYFTQDVKPLKSIPLASQTQTNYGLMRVAGAFPYCLH